MPETYFSGSHPRRQIGNSVFVATANKPQIPIIGSVFTVGRTAAEKTPVTSVTIQNVVAGSAVKVSDAISGAVITKTIANTSPFIVTAQFLGAVKVTLAKADAAPFYKPWQTQLTINGQPQTITALQDLD